jgi:[ribosomal protein S5]-alanine N-acetyltransferase
MMHADGIRLVGDRLVLREFVLTDEHAVHSFAADPLVTRFTDWGPNSVEDARAFLGEATAQMTDPKRADFTLAAVHAASDKVIGSVAIRVTSVQHRRGEFG